MKISQQIDLSLSIIKFHETAKRQKFFHKNPESYVLYGSEIFFISNSKFLLECLFRSVNLARDRGRG